MIHKGSKRTIFVSGELELVQMTLEPITEQCASENTRVSRRVDCEIPCWLERETEHSL